MAPDQEKSRRRAAGIVFVDETGFSSRGRVTTTRAPRGDTPVQRRVSERRELSTAIGLTVSGRIYKRRFDHAIRGPDSAAFLRHLRRLVGRPMIVIRDRLQAHRSREVKAYLAEHREIVVEWLPTCCPELNPEGGRHGDVKQGMRDAVPEDVDAIRRHANRGFARLRHRPDVILSFFHHAGYRMKQLS